MFQFSIPAKQVISKFCSLKGSNLLLVILSHEWIALIYRMSIGVTISFAFRWFSDVWDSDIDCNLGLHRFPTSSWCFILWVLNVASFIRRIMLTILLPFKDWYSKNFSSPTFSLSKQVPRPVWRQRQGNNTPFLNWRSGQSLMALFKAHINRANSARESIWVPPTSPNPFHFHTGHSKQASGWDSN